MDLVRGWEDVRGMLLLWLFLDKALLIDRWGCTLSYVIGIARNSGERERARERERERERLIGGGKLS
jgi:hypothetical protein